MSKGKAVIRESVSPYPSKINERLAYFIFNVAVEYQARSVEKYHRSNQIQGVTSLVFLDVLGNLSLLFIMFVQDCVSCAIKHLLGYSNKI